MAKEKASGIFPKMQVIIAALNEEDGIGLTIAELKEYLSNPRILMVDGKSSDNTVHVAKSLGADVLFQKGEGKGDAIDYALRNVDTDHLNFSQDVSF